MISRHRKSQGKIIGKSRNVNHPPGAGSSLASEMGRRLPRAGTQGGPAGHDRAGPLQALGRPVIIGAGSGQTLVPISGERIYLGR